MSYKKNRIQRITTSNNVITHSCCIIAKIVKKKPVLPFHGRTGITVTE